MKQFTLVCRLLKATRRHIEHEAPGTENSPVCSHHTAFARHWSATVFRLPIESNPHAAFPLSAICTG